ncbi:MAG TPA: hypothetical protein VHV76_11555 [Mycobacteriales bacterium]|jgi:hypothetical protein|nr:hypothetical protein [Mycobacteriales bacterium]
MPTAFQNASRKRAALAVAAYGVILAGILGFVVTPIAAVAVVAVTALLIWRNLVGGLFVTADSVVVRNLTYTQRLPRSEIAEVTVMAGADDTTGAGYVCVITEDGTCHRATGLRRDPLRGEALAAAIRDRLARP